MKYTTNYNLRKPDLTDNVNIEDLNENADIIDTELDKIPILTQKADNLELSKVEISTFNEAMKNIKANDKEARQEIMNVAEMLAFLNKTGVGFYDLFTNTNYVDTVGTTATILDSEVNFTDAKTLKMKPQTFHQFKELELNIYDKNRTELQATESTTTTSMKVIITPSSVKVGDKFYYNGEVYTVNGVV